MFSVNFELDGFGCAVDEGGFEGHRLRGLALVKKHLLQIELIHLVFLSWLVYFYYTPLKIEVHVIQIEPYYHASSIPLLLPGA